MTSSDDEPRSSTRQEIMPPISTGVSTVPETWQLPQGFLGSALFARARYASEQKQVEAYTRLVTAKNALIRVMAEQQSLIANYAGLAERARNLDVLRLIARMEMDNKLNAIENQGKLAKLTFESEAARLEYERDRYRLMRDQLHAPAKSAPSPAPTPTMADNLKSVAGQIDEIERAHQEIREALIASAGGEENLPQQVRIQLGQYEELRNKLIHDVMSELM